MTKVLTNYFCISALLYYPKEMFYDQACKCQIAKVRGELLDPTLTVLFSAMEQVRFTRDQSFVVMVQAIQRNIIFTCMHIFKVMMQSCYMKLTFKVENNRMRGIELVLHVDPKS